MDKYETENVRTDYLLKRKKSRDEELKYDFMPQIQEIIERPACRAGRIIIFSILTLLIVTIVWASLSKIDVVVTSSGTIQPVGNLNVVQSYANGSVVSINVTEGAYVEKGDVLIELDSKSLDIDVLKLTEQKEILEAQRKIYTQIANGGDVSDIDITAYKYEMRPYIQTISDNDASYRNTLADLKLQKDNAILSEEIANLKLQEYESYGSWYDSKMQELIVKQNSLSVEQAMLQITDLETQYSAQVNEAISNINNQLAEIENSLEQYELSLKNQQLTAPVSGYVNSINVNTPGEAVTSGQDLITIVPVDMPMEMVCYVKNMDIADIEIGMEAEIKLEAYPYNKYGTVKGKVKYISPSSFISEEMGSVYLVKLEIIDKHEEIDIISGLSGSVEIKTGERTIMEYFMEPIIKGFGESLKEK